MSNETRFLLTGDSSDAEAAFAKVGSSSKDMADDVDTSSRRLADSTHGASEGIAGAVDASEGKFRGLGDVIGGTGDVMDGFREGNVAQMAMGFADLAGGMTELVIPALTALKGFLLTGLAPALTAISAHPLIAGILIGGAIIGGLFLLEKKFGIVSDAVRALKGAFDFLWEGVKFVLNGIAAGLEGLVNIGLKGVLAPLAFANAIPGVGALVPDVPTIHLPRLHTGGIAGRDTLAVLQQGEQVIPRGQGRGEGLTINISGVGMGRDFGEAVARALRDNRLIGATV